MSSEDICSKLQSLWVDDPLFLAMESGTASWGDLLLTKEDLEDRPPPKKEEPAPVAEESSSNNDFVEVSAKKQRREIVVPPIVPGIRTLIARNLPRDITVEELRNVFEKFGPIKDVYIPKNMDKDSPHFGTIKGFALIKFLKSSDSAKAFTQQYGRLKLGTNKISLEFAKQDKD